MATLVYNVKVNDAALDRLIAKTQALGGALYSAQLAAKPLDVQLRAIGRRSTEVGRFLMRNVTAPLVLAGAAAGKMGYEFDQSLTRTRALTGATADEMVKFKKEVLALGEAGLGGPKELADALYFIRSSGIPAAQTTKVLTASAKAAFAGLGSIAEVADTVTSAMNAYSDSAKSATYYTDTLVEAVKVGKAEPDALGRAIGRVIPLAHQMGVTFHETLGAVAALTQQGLSADSAVTGLRAVMTTFTKQLKPTKDALAGLGFRFSDVQKAIGDKGLFPTLLRLRKEVDKFGKTGGGLDQRLVKAAKLGGLDKAVETLHKELGDTSNTILGKLFPNVRALTAFLILTANGGKQAAAAIADVGDASGATEKALKDSLLSPSQQLLRTWNQLRTEATKVGEKLYPLFGNVLKFATDMLKVFQKLPKPVREFLALNLAAFAAIGPLFYAIGLSVRALSVLAIKRIKDEKNVQRSLTETAAAQRQVGVAAANAATAHAAATNAMISDNGRLTASQVKLVRNAISPGGFGIVSRETGKFVSPKKVELPPVQSFRLFSREAQKLSAAKGVPIGFVQSFRNLRPAIAGAALALRGFMASMGPLLAFEGFILLIQNWKTVKRVIGDATNALAQFLGLQKQMPDVAAETVASQKALNGLTKRLSDEMTRLHSKGLKWSAAMKQATTNILGADFHRQAEQYGRTIARALMVATGRVALPESAKVGKAIAATIAKNAAAEFKRDQLTRKAIEDLLGTALDHLQDQALTAFDAITDNMIKNLRYKVTVLVNGVRRSFTLTGDQKTPMERELDALDKATAKLQAYRELRDAREALRGMRPRHTVEEVGNRIFRVDFAGGTPQEIRAARERVRDARTAIRRMGMEEVAAAERKAADVAYEEATKQLKARRDLLRWHFTQELAIVNAAVASGKLTAAQAAQAYRKIFAKYLGGPEYMQNAGKVIGTAFATGFNESLAGVLRLVRRLRNQIEQLKDDAAKAATKYKPPPKPRPARVSPAQVGGAAGGGTVPLGPPLPPNYVPTPAGGALTPSKGLWPTMNFYVTDDTQAAIIANKVVRKVTQR